MNYAPNVLLLMIILHIRIVKYDSVRRLESSMCVEIYEKQVHHPWEFGDSPNGVWVYPEAVISETI